MVFINETKRQISQKLQRLLYFKAFVFGYGFITMLESIFALSFGVYFLIYRKFTGNMRRIEKYDESMTSEVIRVAAVLAIIFSIYVVLTTVIGSLSIIKESYIGIILYTVLIVASLGALISFGIWAVVEIDYMVLLSILSNLPILNSSYYYILQNKQHRGTVSDSMRLLFQKASFEGDRNAVIAVRKIQKSLKCCGNVGPSDYGGDIPPSCYYYRKGCNENFFKYYRKHLVLVAIYSFTFSFLKFIGIAINVFLAKEIRLAKSVIENKKRIRMMENYEAKKLLQLQ